jgi:signal peptidase II
VVAGSHQRGGTGLRRASIAALVAVLVILVDQLTKWWAVTRLSSGPIHVIGTLDFQLTRNTGASFSLFTGRAALLIPVALVVAAGLCAMAWRAQTNGRAAIYGLIIGGALGNLSDRIFRGDHGAVVDFVALHFWPTFNVADSCIVVGCVLLVISWFRAPRSG